MQAQGYDQVLWLYGPSRLITEVDISNVFMTWKNKVGGQLELMTPGLKNNLILPSITRASVVELAQSHSLSKDLDRLEITEQQFSITDEEEA